MANRKKPDERKASPDRDAQTEHARYRADLPRVAAWIRYTQRADELLSRKTKSTVADPLDTPKVRRGCVCPSKVCACKKVGATCACACSIYQPRNPDGRKGLMADKIPRCASCSPPGLQPFKKTKKEFAGRYPVEENFEA